jgi:phage virion morphogenesis protein
MRPFFVSAGEYLVRSTQDRFPTETDPEGRPWQKLKPATMERKKTKKILREEGHLQDTIHYQADNSNVRVGSVRVYAAIHQLGGEIKKRQSSQQKAAIGGRAHFARRAAGRAIQMPQRAYLGISRTDRERILEIAEDFLMEG